ncbi:Major Facilitator Superfamily (MFS), partial [Pseudoloma neurophilia]
MKEEPEHLKSLYRISMPMIMFFTSTSINLFQNFIFNIVGKRKGVTISYNIGLQVFSFLNFVGSSFWTYLADKTRNHQAIFFFNCIMYGVLAFFLFMIDNFQSVNLKLNLILFITICREFTLSGFTSIMFALIINYCKRYNYDNSLLGMANVCYNSGVAFAMFLNWAISYFFHNYNIVGIFVSFFIFIA